MDKIPTDLARQIVKGEVASYAVGDANHYNLSNVVLSNILKEIADELLK